MITIGIDPGKTGGVAWLNTDHNVPLAVKMPGTTLDIVWQLRAIVDEADGRRVVAYLEQVGPRRGYDASGKNTRSSSREWTFAEGFGALKGILLALNISFELVTPQKWQKSLQCLTGGDKNVSKAKAQQLWPGERWTHATADAALICEYGRRQHLREYQERQP